MLQWGHGDEAVEEAGQSKSHTPGRIASMGPRHEAVEEAAHATIAAPPLNPLQWGHGDEAVEEADHAAGIVVAGTLQWGHGDEAVEEQRAASRVTAASLQLQWGHGDEAVEEH